MKSSGSSCLFDAELYAIQGLPLEFYDANVANETGPISWCSTDKTLIESVQRATGGLARCRDPKTMDPRFCYFGGEKFARRDYFTTVVLDYETLPIISNSPAYQTPTLVKAAATQPRAQANRTYPTTSQKKPCISLFGPWYILQRLWCSPTWRNRIVTDVISWYTSKK